MPQCSIETTLVGQSFCLFGSHSRRESSRSAFEDISIAHDVGTQQYRSSVATREIAFVWKYRCSVATSSLAKVRDDIVDANRYVLSNFLVVLIRKRVLECLKSFHRLAESDGFLLPSHQQRESK